jgi:hypothetical protein
MGLVEFLVRMTADNSDLKKKMKDSENATKSFGTSVGKMAGMMGLSFAAAGAAVVAFSLASYKAWQESEKMSRKLMASVKGNETAFKALTSQAGKLQRELGVDDESIMQLQSLAASSDKSTEEIKKLTEASVYLSKVTGQDLQAAYLQINNTFTGSAGRLGRLDDEFSTLTKEQLIHGDAVDLVIKKYKDLAKAQTTTPEKMSSNWENLKENIGQFAGPTVNNLLEGFNNWLVLINSNLLTTGEKLKLAFTFTSPEALINEKQAVLDNVEAWKLYDIQQSQIGFLKTAAGIDAVTAAMKRLYAKNYGEGGKWAKSTIVKPTGEPKGNTYVTGMNAAYSKAQDLAQFDIQVPLFNGAFDALQNTFVEINGITQQGNASILQYRDSITDTASAAKTLTEQLKAMADAQEAGWIAGDMFNAVANAEINSIEDLGKVVWNTARQIIAAKLAETIANSIASVTGIPFPFNLIAAGVAGAGAGAIFNQLVPKLAEGGIASGPSMAMVGEYAGAKSNPEVIAPLSKLQNMLGNRQQVEVVGYISGDVIRLANKRSEYIYNRRG